MLVEITSVNITEDKISIVATDLESLLLVDDLFAEVDDSPVQFDFDRHEKNGAAMKYLYKVCQNRKECAKEKSMGEKLEKLTGLMLNLADSFRVH